MALFKKFAFVNKGLRYKLMLAFSLMTIIPILAFMYVVSLYVFPQLENLINVSTIALASIIIAMLGLLLARGLVDPVIDMAIEAKIIASGEYDRKIAVAGDDEIGNLGQSINAMTQKIRSNLEELKGYGQRMREINVDIHKKVLALSSLLQIGDIISSGSIQLDSLLEMALEKTTMIFEEGFGVLYMPKAPDEELVVKLSHNVSEERLGELVIQKGGKGVLEKVLEDRSIFILDKGVKMSKDIEDFKEFCNLKNIIAVPIYSGNKSMGMLVVGNRVDNYRFKTDDIDLVKVFAKQMTIAIESDILNRKTKELAIIDDLTGLYNKTFVLTRLEEEIKRAIFYQRPCSFIVFNIDNFKKFRETQGELMAEDALRKIAKIVKDNITPVGKAARIGGDEFAMLLPEKNKKEAAHLAEDVRRKIESTNLGREGKVSLTVSVGVSENPIDGATSDELFKKANEAVREAKLAGKNKVVA